MNHKSLIFLAALLHLQFAALANIEITEVTHISAGNICDGKIDITASGPTGNGIYPCTFEWTGPAGFIPTTTEDIEMLCTPGVYVVKITFADGSCTVSLSVTLVKCVTYQPNPQITNECSPGSGDGVITIAPTAGGTAPFTFLWSNGATTQSINNLTTGQYCISITDMYGCKSTPGCYDLAAYPPLTVGVESYPGSPNCTGSGGTVNTIFQGGHGPFTALWSTGETSPFNINVSTSGYYAVTITDACGHTASAGVNYVIAPAITLVLTKTNLCGLPTDLTSNVSGGGGAPYTYIWSNAAQTQSIPVIATGTYTLTVTSSIGCTASQSATIYGTAFLSLNGTVTGTTFGSCKDGAIVTNISGGVTPYQFNWNGPPGYQAQQSQNISGLAVGTYCVTVTDANGCTKTGCYAVISNTSVGIDNVVNVSNCGTTNIDCGSGNVSANNGSIHLIKIGATTLSYLWPNGSTTMNVSNLAQGIYTVTITSPGGCTQTLTATICCCYVNFSGSNYSPGCITPCSWLTNQAPTALGIQISNLIAPQTNATQEGAIDISIMGGANSTANTQLYYSWTGPNEFKSTSEDLSGIGAGNYCVTVTNGCSSTNTCVQVNACSTLAATAQIKKSCSGYNNGNILLNASGGNIPLAYLWNNGVTTSSLQNLAGGVYTVKITDFGDCVLEKTFTVATSEPTFTPQSNPCGTKVNCNGESWLEPVNTYPSFIGCNQYREICPLTGGYASGLINLPIGIQYPEIFDPIGCTLFCGGATGNPAYGIHVNNHEAGFSIALEDCYTGSGCVFEDVVINGVTLPSYFVLSQIIPSASEIEKVATDEGCIGNGPMGQDGCRTQYYCFGRLVGQTPCDYPIPPASCSIARPANITLIEHLYRLNKDSKFTNYGIDASVDIFTTTITEYSQLHNKKQLQAIRTYSRAEVDQLYSAFLASENLEIYPNPFDEFIYFPISKWTSNDNIDIQIYDILGNLVCAKLIAKYASEEDFKIETINFPAGLYHLIIKTKTSKKSFTIIKITAK